MKPIQLTFLLLLFTVTTWAQSDFDGPKKVPQIGFSGNLTDFSASLPKIGKVEPGFSVFFWNGLTSHLDYSLRYNGLFSSYQKAGTALDRYTDYKNEAELAFHLKALSDDHLLNPFLTAGVGVGNYARKELMPYAPLGLGLQLNLFSEGYVYLQGNYRLPFNNDKLDKNTFFSLGVAQPLVRRKAAIAPPLPPVEKDTDNDGLPDSQDNCPTVAGPVENKGCPWPDTDGDGVLDKDDNCPDKSGPAENKGCPWPDKDGDGVADKDDRCPTVPGPASNNGCPEVKEEVKKKVAEAARAIYFVTNGDQLEKRSFPALNIILGELEADKDLKLDIAGHTDNVGKEEYNQGLSERRANAVYNWLVEKGIDSARLSAAGFGETQPVADNGTAKGRQLNRRTDMKLHYD